MKLKHLFPLLIFLFISSFVGAQNKVTLNGYVKDKLTGETLIGANVLVVDKASMGTITNAYGFYSLSVSPGQYQFKFSYLGYADEIIDIDLQKDVLRNVELKDGVTIDEVVVTAKEKDKNVESTDMGTIELGMETVKKLPSFMGEVDILKTLQLLPGVLSAGEGNTGFYVRGGGPDQNLVLLDEAVVYNPGHMLGFFSVFNADAIKNTTLIKGGMPANYGGRLSSVVDIQMKEGNDKKYEVAGGIGLVASRLTIEGPIIPEKSSFIVSGRRTYAFDLAQPFLNGSNFEGTNYYFYDFNGKINHRFSDKDRIFFSAYFGRDILNYNSEARGFGFRMPYGNSTATLRWNHLFSSKLFMNVSAIYNDYDFAFSGSQSEFSFNLFSGVRDYNGKIDFDYYLSTRHSLKFGIDYTYHKLTPNILSAASGDVEFSLNPPSRFANETAVYILDEIKFTDKFSINVGLRGTMFSQVGPYTSKIDGQEFDRLEKVKTYTGLEPRFSTRVKINDRTSLKAGVTFNNQYIHLVSNSTSSLPTDLWVASSEIIEPQRGVQYALGYFQNLKNDVYETSVEVYYKDLQNQIDYRENFVDDPTLDVEDEFVFGSGRAYGLELFLKKRTGKLNGWIGYTLSRTERTFPDIQNGEVYPARFDRTHDLSIVANYTKSNKWDFGAAFVYGTGNTFTPVQSLYFIEQNLNVEYGNRNSQRLDAYHRLDFSATYTPKPQTTKNFKSFWTFSVYNIYNRRNPTFVYNAFETDLEAGTGSAKAFKVSLFPVIPSVTWNFKWNQK